MALPMPRPPCPLCQHLGAPGPQVPSAPPGPPSWVSEWPHPASGRRARNLDAAFLLPLRCSTLSHSIRTPQSICTRLPKTSPPLGLHHLGLVLTWSPCHQTSLKSTLLMATCAVFPPATHVTFFSCWRLQWLPKCMDLTSVVLCNLAQCLTAYPACSGHPPRPHILAPSLLWSTHTWDSDLWGLFAFSDLPGPIKLPCFCMWQALCLKALNSHFLAWQLQGTLILFASHRHEQFCFLSSFRLPSALCHSIVNLCFLACFLH